MAPRNSSGWRCRCSSSSPSQARTRGAVNTCSAVALGDDNFASLSKKLLEDYLVQHQATMDLLREAKDMTAMQRAETLASMSDSWGQALVIGGGTALAMSVLYALIPGQRLLRACMGAATTLLRCSNQRFRVGPNLMIWSNATRGKH